jgi:hypothetical protein
MPSYRIHRLKDHLRQQYRSAPHVSGAAGVKPRDYLPGVVPGEAAAEFSGETISASSPYAAFFELKNGAAPLAPGDLLEDENGALRIFKYVGFEPAQWVLPEVLAATPEVDSAAAEEAPANAPGA